jgi:hypothetical protein
MYTTTMPKKPKDQSREEKKWVRKWAYLFLCDARNAYSARSPGIHVADPQTFESTCASCRLRRSTRNRRLCNGTRYTSPVDSGENLRRHLGFQMDDIWYGHLGIQLDDTSIQDLRWLIPPLRVLDGWDLHLGFQTDVTFVEGFLMDETFIYSFRLNVTFMERSSSMIPRFTI